MTFTPGPWKVMGNFIGTDEVDPQTIAYLSDHRNQKRRSEEETQANGRLIAKAPRLLDALKAMCRVHELSDVLDADSYILAYNNAQHVIAEVEGTL